MRLPTNNSMYEKIHYDGKDLSVRTITVDELRSIDKKSVDCFLAVDRGEETFHTLEGKWIERKLSEDPLGNICLKVLEVIMCEPGVYYPPKEIAELTGIDSLRNPNNLSARLRALRLAHNETFRKPNFFLSKRTGGMGIAWNPEKSFIQIVRIGRNAIAKEERTE